MNDAKLYSDFAQKLNTKLLDIKTCFNHSRTAIFCFVFGYIVDCAHVVNI